MPNEKPQSPAALPALPNPPQWVWLFALALGVPVSGSFGGMFATNEAAEKIEDVEKAQDELDKKIDRLTYYILRAHPDLDIPPR